ncbi:MAG: glyceraldehyde 3-phosphate dehydrogenase NAD-binding domain-containing protein, partial [Clostridia bacterium]
MIKIGINGFGRIGRLILRESLNRNDMVVVAVNDPFIDLQYAKYMFIYDSIHGQFNGSCEVIGDKLVINGKEIAFFAEKEPNLINWKSVGAEIIAEATGKFTIYDDAAKHFIGGAKKVVVTAPG